jgi:hypothetical protein
MKKDEFIVVLLSAFANRALNHILGRTKSLNFKQAQHSRQNWQ